MMEEVFPPGVPTVERQGPLLPALETNTTPCSSASSLNSFTTALKEEGEGEGRGGERRDGEERRGGKGWEGRVTQSTNTCSITMASTEKQAVHAL